MISLFRTLFFWMLALLAAIVAVANRHDVPLSFDPFNAAAPAILFHPPLYAIILAAVLIGIVLGSWSAWLSQSHIRLALRDSEDKIRRLEREVEVAQKIIVKPTGRAVEVR